MLAFTGVVYRKLAVRVPHYPTVQILTVSPSPFVQTPRRGVSISFSPHIDEVIFIAPVDFNSQIIPICTQTIYWMNLSSLSWSLIHS